MVKGRVLAMIAGISIAVLGFGVVAVRAWQFRDRFVMVTVEESSTSAVTAWPLLAERLPGSFVDAASRTICVDDPPGLLGVSLCLHYSATSQGIEIADSVRFSRTGRTALELDRPLSYVSNNLDGEQIELVDNAARIVAGRFVVEKTSADGRVTFSYGGRRVTLMPGESWAELLAFTPDGPRAVDQANWESEFHGYLGKGYPTTRLAVANRGFWPKASVVAGMAP